MNKSFLVIQLGARHKYFIPRFFYSNNSLFAFITDGAHKGIIKFFFKKNKYFKKRNISNIKPIYSANFLGLIHFFLRKIFRNSSIKIKNYIFLFAAFSLNMYALLIIVLHNKKNFTHVYGNNGALLLTFLIFKNKFKIVEQVIAPRAFMSENIKLDKVSKKYFGNNMVIYENDLRQKVETKEWFYSNLIICPSNFVKDNLIKCGVKEDKIKVINYGVDINLFKTAREKSRIYSMDQTLNILFVGEVGLRKGSAYLIESLKNSDFKFKCRFVGANLLNSEVENNHFIFEGIVDKDKIEEYYIWADVLILPSFWEGSATVLYEATASGLPVIASKNAGAPNTSNIIELNEITTTEILNSINFLRENYINFLPTKKDIFHISHDRYNAELTKTFEL